MSTDKSRKEKAKKTNDLYRDTPSYINKTLRFALPIPPSVNHLHIRTRKGKMMLTNKALEFIRDSRALINLAIEEQNFIMQEYAVWQYIDLVFYMPDRKIRDASNCLKILLDVMQGIVYENDTFALPRIQSVEYDPENPRVEVIVRSQQEKDRISAKNLTRIV